ncbi:MAG TPA: methyltransferase domain-containing protein, partial [Candidatus Thermoplasmatota archaeon]|nr:methyltransferase domain-containing protein [Candidatus Thermoplasmatota archaeon]
GFDERLVEYPWALARLPPGPGRVLDAGSVLNNPELLRHAALREKKVDILTLGPEEGCYWWTGASYVFDDLRRLPFRDALYDDVVCVSTLEHVGFDNTGYTGDVRHRESDPTSHRTAIAEFARVLRPGGSLLLTVPFGKLVRIEVGQQFDEALLDEAVRAFGPAASVERSFYAYSREGWRAATAAECSDLEFVRWRAFQPWPKPLPVEPDLAASARAVACVRVVK